MSRLVIGIGNSFRRDDGVGLAVAEEIARLDLPGVEVLTAIGEPGAILDAWTDAKSVVIIDAALTDNPSPGRIRRWTPDASAASGSTSSHALGLRETYALGQALGRTPRKLLVLTVDAADVSLGDGLTPDVSAVVPQVVRTVLAEIKR